jgi:hypothetical protein
MNDTTPPLVCEQLPPPVADELLATLPPVLRAVVRSLGLVRGREFLLDHGGVNWNVPQRSVKRSGLTESELKRLAVALKPHMDENRRVWLPKADKLLIRARDMQIRRDRHTTSVSQLAHRYHLSGRHILNVCRDDDDAQLGLF